MYVNMYHIYVNVRSCDEIDKNILISKLRQTDRQIMKKLKVVCVMDFYSRYEKIKELNTFAQCGHLMQYR